MGPPRHPVVVEYRRGGKDGTFWCDGSQAPTDRRFEAGLSVRAVAGHGSASAARDYPPLQWVAFGPGSPLPPEAEPGLPASWDEPWRPTFGL